MEVSHNNDNIISLDNHTRKGDTPLSQCVKKAVDKYFSHLKGHDVTGLHALVLSEVEKPLIEAALEHAGFNQTKAAKILGLSRSTLRKKMDQFKL